MHVSTYVGVKVCMYKVLYLFIFRAIYLSIHLSGVYTSLAPHGGDHQGDLVFPHD